GDERREIYRELPHRFAIAASPGTGWALTLASVAAAPGEPALPGQPGVVAWVEGSRPAAQGPLSGAGSRRGATLPPRRPLPAARAAPARRGPRPRWRASRPIPFPGKRRSRTGAAARDRSPGARRRNATGGALRRSGLRVPASAPAAGRDPGAA